MDFFFPLFLFLFFLAWFVSPVLKCIHQLNLIIGETSIQVKKDCRGVFLICRELEKRCTLAAAEEDNEGWVIPCCCYDYSAAQFKPALSHSSTRSPLGMEMLTNGLWKCLSLSSLPCFSTACFDGSTFKAPPMAPLWDVLCWRLCQPQRLLSHHTRETVCPLYLCNCNLPSCLQLYQRPPKSQHRGCQAVLCTSLCCRVPAGGLIVPPGWRGWWKASAPSASLSVGAQPGSDSSPLIYRSSQGAGGEWLISPLHLLSRKLAWRAQIGRQTSPWLEGEGMGFALWNAREATGASCGLVSEGFIPYWLLFPIFFFFFLRQNTGSPGQEAESNVSALSCSTRVSELCVVLMRGGGLHCLVLPSSGVPTHFCPVPGGFDFVMAGPAHLVIVQCRIIR